MSKSSEHEPTTLDPPPVDPLKPAIPISYPIMTLEELGSRSYFNSFHYPFNRSSVKLQASALQKRPRILVCHDMQGGYVDDKWVQGGTKEDAFAIWHWYLIDAFVYFSHYLVTLPPPCWINTAHRHGVKVLGTFITEGDKGRAICDKLLATKASAQMYAERLTELSVKLGFDGWLINMEIDLDAGQIPIMKEFVSHLTQTMHSSVPGSLVIWYDSVTVDGSLSYQNQLNERNKPFFDICDGLFANYQWTEDDPKVSADNAGARKFDVYMGIDVFGRGTYKGGGWNTNLALDVVKKNDVSAAIFAPGWVYETNQPPDFQTAQNRWWGLVEKSWGVNNFYPKSLPFYTNFDQGHGYHISVDGEQVIASPWNNISSQSFQPFLEFSDNPPPDTIKVLVDFKEASYSGGASITFKGTLKGNTDFTTKLFQGELLLGELPLHMTYSVRSEGDSLLGLSLQFSSTNNEKASILLASQATHHLSNNYTKLIVPKQVKSPETSPGWVIQESSIEMNGYTLTEIHALCYRPKPESHELQSAPNPTDYFAVLGHITLKPSTDNPNFPPSSSWYVGGQYKKWGSDSQGSKTLCLEITWKLIDGSDLDQFSRYNIYIEKLTKQEVGDLNGIIPKGVQDYLGVAYMQAFYISELHIPPSTSSLRFTIQPCSIDGIFQELDDSPYFQVNVEDQ